MNALPACVTEHLISAWCPESSEEAMRSQN